MGSSTPAVGREEYLLEELDDEVGGLPPCRASWGREPIYWTGYLYRLWHYLTGETSRAIYATADADTMGRRLPRHARARSRTGHREPGKSWRRSARNGFERVRHAGFRRTPTLALPRISIVAPPFPQLSTGPAGEKRAHRTNEGPSSQAPS